MSEDVKRRLRDLESRVRDLESPRHRVEIVQQGVQQVVLNLNDQGDRGVMVCPLLLPTDMDIARICFQAQGNEQAPEYKGAIYRAESLPDRPPDSVYNRAASYRTDSSRVIELQLVQPALDRYICASSAYQRGHFSFEPTVQTKKGTQYYLAYAIEEVNDPNQGYLWGQYGQFLGAANTGFQFTADEWTQRDSWPKQLHTVFELQGSPMLLIQSHKGIYYCPV